MSDHEAFLSRAIELARQARAAGDHPFGAVLVLDGRIVVEARNTVVTSNSPLCHAETNLVGEAVRTLTRQALGKSVLYASCEPCAMCVGAMYWAGIRSLCTDCRPMNWQHLPEEISAFRAGNFCRGRPSRSTSQARCFWTKHVPFT